MNAKLYVAMVHLSLSKIHGFQKREQHKCFAKHLGSAGDKYMTYYNGHEYIECDYEPIARMYTYGAL